MNLSDPGAGQIFFLVAFALAFVLGWTRSWALDAERRARELAEILVSLSIADDNVGPSGTENVMPDRVCPFPRCGKPIEPSTFCCRHHWSLMVEADRKRIWAAWNANKARKITNAKLREIHAEVVAKYDAPPVADRPPGPGAALGAIDRKQLERVCLAFEVYLKKDDEYRKCREQDIDRKKKLGMEHRKLRAVVDQLLKEILHPGNGQQALFDNTAPPKGASNMPD